LPAAPRHAPPLPRHHPMLAHIASALALGAPNVVYHGRWVTTASSAVCAWPMSGFTVAFNGSSVAATLTPGSDGARLKVLVDGSESGYVTLEKGASKSTYTLASHLPPGGHEATIFKITEDLTEKGTEGALHLHSVTSVDGQILDPRPVSSSVRRLEFIGDSDTAGWCSDGRPGSGDAGLKYENSFITWAAQLARGVGAAETSTVAVSGWGVTANSHPIQEVYENTFGYGSKSPKWNFSQWVPDAVVILIGPNDELTAEYRRRAAMAVEEVGQPVAEAPVVVEAGEAGVATRPRSPRSSKFITAYLALMTQVAHAYAAAPTPPKIVHVCGGSINGLDPCDDIQAANDEFNQKPPVPGFEGFYTTIGKQDWNMINQFGSKYKGCDAHYSAEGHKVVADDIRPQLEKIMGW